MSLLKLLTFDVVNTVIKVRVSPSHQYAEVAKSYGIKVSTAQLEKVYRQTWQQLKQDFPNYGVNNNMSSRDWWTEFVSRVFFNAGCTGSFRNTTLQEMSNKLYNHFQSESSWETTPEAHSSLSMLKASGMKLGVVSNLDERLKNILTACNLHKYFDFFISSVSAKAEKPDPIIFRYALAEAGVKASEAGHIGDNLVEDYLTARSVGMEAFLFVNDDRDLTGELKKHGIRKESVIRNLNELIKLT